VHVNPRAFLAGGERHGAKDAVAWLVELDLCDVQVGGGRSELQQQITQCKAV
jgi:hypothetical protein